VDVSKEGVAIKAARPPRRGGERIRKETPPQGYKSKQGATGQRKKTRGRRRSEE